MKIIPLFSKEEWNPVLHKILSLKRSLRGHLSHFYKFMHAPLDYSKPGMSTAHLVMATVDVDTVTMLKAWETSITFLPASRYVEMSLQIFHKASITTTQGYRMGILPDNQCYRCRSARGDTAYGIAP